LVGLGAVKVFEGLEVTDLGLEHGREHGCSFLAGGDDP
jgi:hypothetical protein